MTQRVEFWGREIKVRCLQTEENLEEFPGIDPWDSRLVVSKEMLVVTILMSQPGGV